MHEKWVAVLPERAFYLLFGPLVGAAVGAGTMAYMDRSNHGSQLEATVICRRWVEQARGVTRHCIDAEATRQVLLAHPEAQVTERYRFKQEPRQPSDSLISPLKRFR